MSRKPLGVFSLLNLDCGPVLSLLVVDTYGMCHSLFVSFFFTLKKIQSKNHKTPNLLAIERPCPLSGNLRRGRVVLRALQFTACCLEPLQAGAECGVLQVGFPLEHCTAESNFRECAGGRHLWKRGAKRRSRLIPTKASDYSRGRSRDDVARDGARGGEFICIPH